jgi:uncharacterized caspase-like protein
MACRRGSLQAVWPIPTKRIASVLARSQARVLVVLDACHSGSTGSEATNDRAAGELLRGGRAPVLILAASKGRQFSYENPKWGGGIFTHALSQTLTGAWKASDLNRNDALEISEIYQSVKSMVVRETKGEQTPWIVRRDLIGDFALF